jgi:acyl carrier protein
MSVVREPDVLVRCFSAVFPELDLGEITSASVDTVPAWDSLAALTLVASVEEEFGVRIPEAVLVDLTSFDAFAEYLRSERLLP